MEKLNGFITKVLQKLHLEKYKEIILYLIVGGLTTVVDWVVFTLFDLFIPKIDNPGKVLEFIHRITPNIAAYTIAWFAAVVFAFFANKFLVFEAGKANAGKQFFAFTGSRLGTLIFSIAFDFVFTSSLIGLEWNKYLVKAVGSIVVIIVNYIFGKLIFKKKKEEVPTETEEKTETEPVNENE